MVRNEQAQVDSVLVRDVESLTRVFNVADVTTVVTPGQGWKCGKDASGGITLSIDPEQVTTPSGRPGDNHVLFAARHELQHIKDMLDPAWDVHQPKFDTLSASDSFFWNFAHDITIDGRTVHDYRRYQTVAPDLYKSLFKEQDLTKEPKHIQFMTGLRCQAVLGNKSELKVSPDVQQEIDELRNYNGHDIIRTMMHKGTTLEQRIALANKFLKPRFDDMVTEDQDSFSQSDLDQKDRKAVEDADMTTSGSNSSGVESDQTFEEQLEQATGEYKEARAAQEAEASEEASPEQEATENESKTYDAPKLGKRILNAFRNRDNKSDSQETDEQKMQSELAGVVRHELKLSKGDAQIYAEAMIRNRELIKATAEVFMMLARYTRVPGRLIADRHAEVHGSRLHTGRLPQAVIEGQTDIPMAIWRGRTRTAPRVLKEFNGLDVQLLIDASISMNGAPAQYAAELDIILTEGLLLAREHQAKEVVGRQPDVRLGASLFAGDTEEVMPLSYTPSSEARAKAFVNTRRANQKATLVVDGLRAIQQNALENPERDVIGILISDNEFGDYPHDVIRSMPPNCTIFNFVIGWGSGLSRYSETIRDSAEMPQKLMNILKRYQERYTDE